MLSEKTLSNAGHTLNVSPKLLIYQHTTLRVKKALCGRFFFKKSVTINIRLG